MRPELELCVNTFRRWLHLPDAGHLLIALATVAANRMEGDPVWLLLVGGPGWGKTEVLNSLRALPDMHLAATITESALLSGTPRKDRSSTAKGGLLREIGEFGILVLKDFGSILSMHREQRAALLAALREIYDGSWTRHVGVDGGRVLHWEGKVGLVGGCTPTIDSHHSVIGAMGERFVFYRLPATEEGEQARRALEHAGHEKAMRAELAASVAIALESVDPDQLGKPLEIEDRNRLVGLASLAVRCRSAVERDPIRREIELIPDPEAPGRLALVLLRLLNALLAIGVDEPTAWRLVTKAALDSMPAIRRTLLEVLVNSGSRQLETSDISTELGYPSVTTRRGLEDLTAHGVTLRTVQGQGKSDRWELSPWTVERWAAFSEKSTGAYQGPQDPSNGFSEKSTPPLTSTYRKTQNIEEDLSEKVSPEEKASNGHRQGCYVLKPGGQTICGQHRRQLDNQGRCPVSGEVAQ